VTAGVSDALRQRAIAEGWAPDALRGALWDAMVQGAKPPAVPAAALANTAPAQSDPLVTREAMAEALTVRAMPGYQAQDGGRHSEFLGWRPSEMVAELMRARGERNVPRETAKLAGHGVSAGPRACAYPWRAVRGSGSAWKQKARTPPKAIGPDRKAATAPRRGWRGSGRFR
jgi:hypothetical protein